MYKKSLVAVTVAIVTLTGCAPADRVADTVPVTDRVKAEMFGTSPEFERDPLPAFQASCTCGWKGNEWSFKATVREEQAAHRCDEAEPLSCKKQG